MESDGSADTACVKDPRCRSGGKRVALNLGSEDRFEAALDAAVDTLRCTMLAEYRLALALPCPPEPEQCPVPEPPSRAAPPGGPRLTLLRPVEGELVPGVPPAEGPDASLATGAAERYSALQSEDVEPRQGRFVISMDEGTALKEPVPALRGDSESSVESQELPSVTSESVSKPGLLWVQSSDVTAHDVGAASVIAEASSSCKTDSRLKGTTSVSPHLILSDPLTRASNFLKKGAMVKFLLTHSDLAVKERREHRADVYEFGIMVLIIMNTIWLSIEIHLSSQAIEPRLVSYFISGVFCLLFFVDIVLRISCERRDFLGGQNYRWNVFDLVLVILEWVDFYSHVANHVANQDFVRQPIGARILRLSRLRRLGRLFSAFDTCHDFRILLISIRRSAPAFVWVMVVSCGLVYVVALSLTEGAIGYCDDVGDERAELCDGFGNLARSFASVYLAMYDGRRWGTMLQSLAPLKRWLQVLFVIQISFLRIIVVNLILGVLIGMTQRIQEHEGTVLRARAIDARASQLAQIKELFLALDLNDSGAISLDELEIAIADPGVDATFAQLKIDTFDIYSLFNMLDGGGQGAVDMADFIAGMQAIAGGARAIDVVKVQKQCSMILRQLQDMGRPNEPQKASRTRTHKSLRTSTSACSQSNSVAASHWRERFANRSFADAPEIELVEMRAMTLAELRQLRFLIGDLCPQERWQDSHTGAVVRPDEVNLYTLTANFIKPVTAPEGVFMRLPGLRAHAGAKIRQFDEANRCIAEGELIEGFNELNEELASERTASGARVRLARGSFKCNRGRLVVDGVDVDPPTHIEVPGGLSYKEFVSSKPTRPVWFCSHWWGEIVYDFIDCCEEHAGIRRMDPASATYWVCGYANRQHSLVDEIGGELEQTSFYKAMVASQGTLLLLDENAIAFTRIWCDFEIFCTVSGGPKDFDIVTKSYGAPHLLSSGKLSKESARARTLRESKFPISLLVKGMYLRLQDGLASREADKEAILSYISQSGPDGSTLEECLASANNTLHAVFARSGWPQAIKRGMVENFDPANPGALRLPDILRRDRKRQSLCMSLGHIDQVTNAEVKHLALGLPPNLVELVLSFEGCQHVTSDGLAAIAQNLPPSLRVLKLDFLGCVLVDDSGMRALAEHLPVRLQTLDMHFDRCDKISADGLRMLADKIPKDVKKFHGTFRGTGVDRNFRSVRELQDATCATYSRGGLTSRLNFLRPWPHGPALRSNASRRPGLSKEQSRSVVM